MDRDIGKEGPGQRHVVTQRDHGALLAALPLPPALAVEWPSATVDSCGARDLQQNEGSTTLAWTALLVAGSRTLIRAGWGPGGRRFKSGRPD
jgi:hypothetical protein